MLTIAGGIILAFVIICGEGVMVFRLTYDGPLRSTNGDNDTKRARKAYSIRLPMPVPFAASSGTIGGHGWRRSWRSSRRQQLPRLLACTRFTETLCRSSLPS